MHLPALQSLPDVRVVAVASRSGKSARAAADRFGVPRSTNDYMELLDDPYIDVIDIVAPNDLHGPIAIAAAERGKHVICIKPLALTVAEADEMIAAATKAEVRLFYAENVPFIPAVRRAREVVDQGGVGEVFRVKACEGIGAPHATWFLDPARSGGGVTIDMAVHSIAFCRFMTGSEVDTVSAEMGTFVHKEAPVEDTVVMTLRFHNGAIGQCEDSWSLPGAMDSRFEVFGTKGRILIDNLHRQPIQVASDSGGWTFPLPISGDIADGHRAMLRHFIDCLRSAQKSESEGVDGLVALSVVEAALRSARSGRREAVAAVGVR
jgi:predicted dehydrogenase